MAVGDGFQPCLLMVFHIVLLQCDDNGLRAAGSKGDRWAGEPSEGISDVPIETIRSERLPPPIGPFSPAIRSGGFIFLSGQVGVDPATGKLAAGGVEAEARQLFANLATLLDAAGKSFGDVVRAGVFLTDMGDFAAVN